MKGQALRIPKRSEDAEDLEPLEWGILKVEGRVANVFVRCTCGEIYDLSGHQVRRDGAVSPHLHCTKDGCELHRYIHLMDWEYGDWTYEG